MFEPEEPRPHPQTALIEQPGDRLDLRELWGILFGLIAVLVVGPVVVFISMATRIGGTRREQRFAALRLIGATRWQTAVLAERSSDRDSRSPLDPRVVAVHVFGAPEPSLAPLMSLPGVVVARRGISPGQIVVSCADLARVTEVACPMLPAEIGEHPAEHLFRLEDIFSPYGFAEPGPDVAELRIQTLFIPTDGTQAAEERLRTLAATTVPSSRSQSERELAAQAAANASNWDIVLPVVVVLVLLVAAGSLTVSAVNGVMERRLPFALLRASGVRLGRLRRVVLLETGVPLALTALGSVGVAVLSTYPVLPREQWVLPSAEFIASLGVGVLAAFALTLIALPILNIATRHDGVRFE